MKRVPLRKKTGADVFIEPGNVRISLILRFRCLFRKKNECVMKMRGNSGTICLFSYSAGLLRVSAFSLVYERKDPLTSDHVLVNCVHPDLFLAGVGERSLERVTGAGLGPQGVWTFHSTGNQQQLMEKRWRKKRL